MGIQSAKTNCKTIHKKRFFFCISSPTPTLITLTRHRYIVLLPSKLKLQILPQTQKINDCNSLYSRPSYTWLQHSTRGYLQKSGRHVRSVLHKKHIHWTWSCNKSPFQVNHLTSMWQQKLYLNLIPKLLLSTWVSILEHQTTKAITKTLIELSCYLTMCISTVGRERLWWPSCSLLVYNTAYLCKNQFDTKFPTCTNNVAKRVHVPQDPLEPNQLLPSTHVLVAPLGIHDA